jgi:hypothetical protein
MAFCFFSLAAVLGIALPNGGLKQRKPAYETVSGQFRRRVVWDCRWRPDWLSNGKRTQLYFLAKRPPLFSPFFEEQRQAIEDRLIDAGLAF